MIEVDFDGRNQSTALRDMSPTTPGQQEIYKFNCYVCRKSWIGSGDEAVGFWTNHEDSHTLKQWFDWRLPKIAREDLDLAERIIYLLDLIEKYGLSELEQAERIVREELSGDGLLTVLEY